MKDEICLRGECIHEQSCVPAGRCLTTRPKCEECGEPATHTDSVPDPNTRGYNLNECGYRIAHYCAFHAAERKEWIGNTTRIKPIPVFEASPVTTQGSSEGKQ